MAADAIAPVQGVDQRIRHQSRNCLRPAFCVICTDGIASRGARYLRFLARRASDRKRGRDGTVYSDYHASGGFLAHHLARISMAAVYWDAQHIDEGVRFLKQHAQPHA